MRSRLFFSTTITGLIISFLCIAQAPAGEPVRSSTYARSTERVAEGGGPGRFELGVGYDYIDLSNAEVDHLHGADVSLFVNLTRWLALGGDFLAGWGNDEQSSFFGDVDISGERYIYVAGPRLSVWPTPAMRIFAQALAGGVHAEAEVNFAGRFHQTISADAFAAIAGGGVDWRFTPSVYWRVIEVDYLRMNLANQESNFRLTTGLVFAFGGRR